MMNTFQNLQETRFRRRRLFLLLCGCQTKKKKEKSYRGRKKEQGERKKQRRTSWFSRFVKKARKTRGPTNLVGGEHFQLDAKYTPISILFIYLFFIICKPSILSLLSSFPVLHSTSLVAHNYSYNLSFFSHLEDFG